MKTRKQLRDEKNLEIYHKIQAIWDGELCTNQLAEILNATKSMAYYKIQLLVHAEKLKCVREQNCIKYFAVIDATPVTVEDINQFYRDRENLPVNHVMNEKRNIDQIYPQNILPINFGKYVMIAPTVEVKPSTVHIMEKRSSELRRAVLEMKRSEQKQFKNYVGSLGFQGAY